MTIVGAAALCFLSAACGGNDDATSRTQVIFDTERLREATTAENPVHRAYLLARAPIATVEDLIERLMAKPPGAALSQDLQP